MTAPLYQDKIELMNFTDFFDTDSDENTIENDAATDTDSDENNFCLDYQSYYVTLTFKYQGSLITLMYSIET